MCHWQKQLIAAVGVLWGANRMWWQVKDWRMWVSFYYKMLILKMDEKDWWLAQSHSSILVAWTLTPEVWFLGTTSGRFPDRGGDGVLDTALFVVHIFLAAVASLTSVPHPLNGSSIPCLMTIKKFPTHSMASRELYLPVDKFGDVLVLNRFSRVWFLVTLWTAGG